MFDDSFEHEVRSDGILQLRGIYLEYMGQGDSQLDRPTISNKPLEKNNFVVVFCWQAKRSGCFRACVLETADGMVALQVVHEGEEARTVLLVASSMLQAFATPSAVSIGGGAGF